jgi:ABC-type multidrug transport system fused ATPase/permease subunit
VNEHNVKALTIASLRKAIGIVPQSVALFNISILENVRYSCLTATDEEVIEACKLAALHEKIISLPDGYHTNVGEKGVKLSGGELQRVAIARVLLKGSPIILLDEATSAVDSLTEAHIQATIQRLTVSRIVFVVAHRLSTITAANRILVLDNGEIIENGTHQELLEYNSKYHELWSTQIASK